MSLRMLFTPNIEATSTILGASHFNLDGDLMDFAASALGAIIVLIVGSIWRARKLRGQGEELREPHAAG